MGIQGKCRKSDQMYGFALYSGYTGYLKVIF